MAENTEREYNAQDILDTIADSPTAYHVVRNASFIIDAEVLHESDYFWRLEGGKTYMVVRNDSSAIFFFVPEDLDEQNACFNIAAVHTDSPTFAVKHYPVIESGGYATLNVEEYGGTTIKSWFDRPLSIAGRVMAKDKNTGRVSAFLVNLVGEAEVVIPTLAPHMGAKPEDEVSVQNEMRPILCAEYADLADLVTKSLQDNFGDHLEIMDWDLMLYNTERPRVLSPSGFAMSARLDDQGCAWSAVFGFAQMLEKCNWTANMIPMLVLYDNEENGSTGYHAASSTFLSDTIKRIWNALALNEPTFAPDFLPAAIARSFMVSADNAHADHPNFASKADPTNKVVLGGGIVLKYAANQKYMTNSRAGAAFMEMCDETNVRYQIFRKNSDIKGGSTLGNISAAQVSVPGVDIGLPQLAMHSAYETCSIDDMNDMIKFFESYFSGNRKVSVTTSEAIYV